MDERTDPHEHFCNAAARLYPRMDNSLRKAFRVCYERYDKVATKKLLSSFQDPTTVLVVRRLVDLTKNAYDIPESIVVGQPKSNQEEEKEEEKQDVPSWLSKMQRGPGVSPCVDNACVEFLKGRGVIAERNKETVSSLDFLIVLCQTAVGTSQILNANEIDVLEVVRSVVDADARE